MSPAKQRASKFVTTAMLKELKNITFDNNELYGKFDNAGQTASLYIPGLEEVPANLQAIAKLSGKELSDEETRAATGKIAAFHTSVTNPVAADRPEVTPSKDFHKMYSLVYHIIPEADTDHSREAIEQVFKEFKMKPPLTREEVSEQLPQILALGKGKGRQY